MPCEWYKAPDGTVMHINRGRSRGRHLKCKFCGADYRENEGKLCDFPMDQDKTCDAAMCGTCAATLGYQDSDIGAGMKRIGDTIDLCPNHRSMASVVAGKLVIKRGGWNRESLGR